MVMMMVVVVMVMCDGDVNYDVNMHVEFSVCLLLTATKPSYAMSIIPPQPPIRYRKCEAPQS